MVRRPCSSPKSLAQFGLGERTQQALSFPFLSRNLIDEMGCRVGVARVVPSGVCLPDVDEDIRYGFACFDIDYTNVVYLAAG